MPLTHDQVLQYVREHGPCVPNDVRQALHAQDNFLVGAVLSELVGQGKLSMSELSLGTSRFYYDPAAPEMLEKVSQHLNEKDLKTYQLLRAEKVLRHNDVTPLLRLSLGNIKDYSRPLRVRTPEGDEQFWHYYLVSPEEAFELIKQRYFHEQKKQEAAPSQPVAALTSLPAPKAKRASKPKAQTALAPTVEGATAVQGVTNLAEGFSKQVHDYFAQKQIAPLQVLQNKKTELSMIVSMPTPVGSVKYFCKAKAKKTTNDGDLASAQLEAQQHKLPLLYIAGGKLTKRAAETVEQLGAVVVQPWA